MRRCWTDKEKCLLRRLYTEVPTRLLAALFSRSLRAVYGQAAQLGLRKSDRFMRRTHSGRLRAGSTVGVATQFKPGHRPHNFGKKGWNAGGNSVKTRFKPGHRPHTWRPVGSFRITKDGIRQQKISDSGYAPRDWRSVHSIVWEQHHGPVPAGHIVVFKNGNPADIRNDNLECISRAENMRRNAIHNLPPALADVCRIRGVLNRRINERTAEHEK